LISIFADTVILYDTRGGAHLRFHGLEPAVVHVDPCPWAAEVSGEGSRGRRGLAPLQYLWGASMLLAPPEKC